MSKKSAKLIAKANYAAQRSKQQARAKRNLAILISALAVVLILVLALVAYVASRARSTAQPEGTVSGTKVAIGYAEPSSIETGRAYWIKSNKLLSDSQISSELASGARVVEYYFDFTCNGCNDFGKVHEAELEKIMDDGKTLVALRPSLSHAGPLAQIANQVLLWSYNNDPDKFMSLYREFSKLGHEHLTSPLYANRSKDPMTNILDANPQPTVEKILDKLGLDKKLATLDPNNPPPGQAALADLAQLRAPKLGISAATPTVIVNGRAVDLKNFEEDPNLITKALG